MKKEERCDIVLEIHANSSDDVQNEWDNTIIPGDIQNDNTSMQALYTTIYHKV